MMWPKAKTCCPFCKPSLASLGRGRDRCHAAAVSGLAGSLLVPLRVTPPQVLGEKGILPRRRHASPAAVGVPRGGAVVGSCPAVDEALELTLELDETRELSRELIGLKGKFESFID